MALSYKARRRLSVLALVVGLPAYIVIAVTVVNWAGARWGRMPIWAEFCVYNALGILWILPIKPIFTGIGKDDPDAPKE